DFSGTFSADATGVTANTTYATPGTYTVALRVTTDNGCIDTVQQVIEIFPNPAAAFTFSDVCADSTVAFDANTSSIASGSIVSYEWDFDFSGTFSADATGITTNHIYPAAGTYTAALRITSDNGCVDTVQQVIEIFPNPTASFTFSDVCADSTVNLDASASSVATGSIASYEWDFDFTGTFSADATGVTANTTYATPGTYTVALRITTDNGCVDTVQQVIEIFPNPTAS
ncbi:MAG: PKD domain-containing protein, partial [Flammeovirgaceae bacterium]